jgi:predicted transcriptional regulator
MAKGSLSQGIAEYVRQHPGSSSKEIFEVMPEGTKLGTVQNLLARLAKQGVLQNRGGNINRHTPAKWYPNDPFIGEKAQGLAHDIYAEMTRLHTSVREQFLAEKIDELLYEARKTKGES